MLKSQTIHSIRNDGKVAGQCFHCGMQFMSAFDKAFKVGNVQTGIRLYCENCRGHAEKAESGLPGDLRDWPKVWTGTQLPDNAPRATVTTLTECAGYLRSRLFLEHCTAGYRYGVGCWHWHAAEYWAVVRIDSEGTRFSVPHASEAEAREQYARRQLRDRKQTLESLKYRPGVMRADIDRANDSLKATRKYGKRGKRGSLVGDDAKRERALIATVERLTAELPDAESQAANATAELDTTTWPE